MVRRVARPPKSGQSWEPLFRNFIGNLAIDSKETGVTKLTGEHIYAAQNRFLSQVCQGLDHGQRTFICLKARQLGITTISLAMDLFWLYVHPGLQGGLVTDDESNREKFRIIIERYINSLPKGMRVGIKKHNRSNLVLNNGSVLDYIVAGKKKKAGGTAVSRAFNFLHATEVSNYGDPDVISDLITTLAQTHPDRLYIYESTARGFNTFWEMWGDAQRDPSQKPFFIGWWGKEVYAKAKGSPEYRTYWDGQLTDEEKEQVRRVREKYGVKMRSEQIAWYRYMTDTQIRSAEKMSQEYPWTEEEAFIATGQSFFQLRRVSSDIQFLVQAEAPFKAYQYHMGDRFTATEVEQVYRVEDADLRVWEEPHPNGVYAVGMDPAYGRSDHKDRHAIEVWRCYADRMNQVAEYATPNPETYQAAWVLAHLAGAYKNCIINLEVSGPGAVIMSELRHLRELLDAAHVQGESGRRGFEDVFSSIRWYLYHRPDSMGAGYVYNWKCLALDTELPTPTGWTTMGAVESGDELLDENGAPCKVLGVSPVKIGAKCYRLTFDDGAEIVADEEHMWKAWRNQIGWYDRLAKTSELVAGKDGVRRAKALCLPHRELPLHPYILGVWLGDGYSGGGRFCSSAEDMPEMSAHLEACGAHLGKIGTGRTIQYRSILDIRSTLVDAGLLNNKHIPAEYLRASYNQRLALLQGLMDTAGHAAVGGYGRCSFTTSNTRLSEGFSELLHSLGVKASFATRHRTLKYAGGESVCTPAFQYWITAYPEMPLFRLKRKLNRCARATTGRRENHHRIVKIDPVASVPVKCVKVDASSSLFLASRSMIPTHNTTQDNKLMLLNQYRDAYATGQLGIRSLPLLTEMQKVVQDGSSIAADGRGKDDCVFAAALANKAWIDWLRPSLIAEGRVYARVTEDEIKAETQEGKTANFVENVVVNFFKQQEARREKDRERRIWATPDFIGMEQ